MQDQAVTISYGAAELKMSSSMEFDCKLAHEAETKRISNFVSIRQLYERIAQAFAVPIDEILFCTLNTHKFGDMNSLLGNYLSIGDLIVVHMCGETKIMNFRKRSEFLGLTITDNGLGRAFIKRVNSADADLMRFIRPGHNIVAINSEPTIGLRHFEVARALREVPLQSEFTLQVIKPLRSNEDEDQLYSNSIRSSKSHQMDKNLSIIRLDDNYNSKTNSLTREPDCQFEAGSYPTDSLAEDLINSSLPIDRLLRHTGSSTSNQTNYKHIIEDINSTLESFLGINDTTLAIQIYRLAKENKDSFDKFVEAIRASELRVFEFGPETERSLWDCALKDTPRS